MSKVALKLSKVLIVSGSDAHSAVQAGLFEDIANGIAHAADTATGMRLLRQLGPELVVVDETVDPSDGLAFVKQATSLAPHVPVIVLTDDAQVELAVAYVQHGALDYIELPLVGRKLVDLISKVMASPAGRSGANRFFSPACPADVPIVTASSGMTEALRTLKLIADSRCNPILILGETGTGKELAARAVHSWRSGEAGEFVAVNCAALTANLLESELFGHVKGAFTGADGDKTGLFELAGEGTILLDEISEMPLDLQAKLLRVLQERTFRKVGGTKDLTCKATIIATSNRDVSAAARDGSFRQDLYYRLAVFPVTLPPLRDEARREDILVLAEFFIENSTISGDQSATGLSKQARRKLVHHDWPGNVRELRNVIERALIVEKGNRISPDSLLIDAGGAAPQAAPVTTARPGQTGDFSLETAEKEFILRALSETGWQRTRAAALLGITRATLHAKLKRYDIKAPDRSEETAKPDSPATSPAELQESTV